MRFSSFDKLEELLYDLATVPRKDKRDAQLISPASYKPDTTRANANVIQWNGWAAVDVDDHQFEGDLQEELRTLYGKYYYVCYSTASSSVSHPKFRLIFPLTDVVPNEKIKHFWYGLNKELGEIGDAQTKDLSRMFYIPGYYNGANNFIFTNKGEIMDPSKIMAEHKFVEKTGGTFLDSLPESLRKEIINHRKSVLTNTDIRWTNYKDCPFVSKKMLDDYSKISETGWYSKMYGIMVSIAGNAVRKKYPITAQEIAQLCREIDRDTGEWYKNRPFDKEAERALQYIFSQNF